MTAGLTAMNGLYGNSYGMQNYYNNPYFLQAYNSPNYNQMIQAQQQMYAQQPATNTLGQTGHQSGLQIPSGTNVNFQGAQSAISNEGKEEKKSNGLAWAIGIGATAIGACWWLASRGKARNATGLWNQIKTGFKSLYKKPNIVKEAQNIAKNKEIFKFNDALKWTEQGANLKGFQFELKNADGVLNRVTVQNGQVSALTDLTKKATKENNLRNITEAYNNGTLNETFKKQIDDIVKMVTDKDVSKLPKGVELKNIIYTAPVEQGYVSYLANAAKAENNGLKFLSTYADVLKETPTK